MQAIGEVLSSSIVGFQAESWEENSSQSNSKSHRVHFGSILRAHASEEELNIYGVVYNVITQPKDNIHKPSALKLTREQLKREQPHIFSLLHTEIQAITICHSINDKLIYRLPPQPPQVHDFVYPVSSKELAALTDNLEFLRLLNNVSAVPPDELIVAVIHEAYAAHNYNYDYIVKAGKTLSQIFKDDYDRLMTVLTKISPEKIEKK